MKLLGNLSTKAVHSSKEVVKPPFFIASSVFFAISESIKAARSEVTLAIPAKPDVFELVNSTKRSIKIQILLQKFVPNEALSSCCQRLGLCLSSSF
ncbi:hypothetical protein N665_0320s0035 [Sinapis alba]|nr:hypothetical protein N665_0320s0035 [Sinapis alba]